MPVARVLVGVYGLLSLTAGLGITLTLEAERQLKECGSRRSSSPNRCTPTEPSQCTNGHPATWRLQMFWPG